MQISGVTKYKFKIDGMKEPVFSETPLRRIEGLELASQLASAGTVEIGQKAYEVGFPKDASGNIVLGQEGKEEYYLQEVDATGSAVGEKRFISIEILKSIAEATSAQERFSTELVRLESQIGTLEGIKTKELYSKLATLQKEVDRISKLVDFSTASAEDTGVKELRKINARIEQLVEKINDAVRELSVDIRRHKTSTDKKTKNKAEVTAEQASEEEMKAVDEEFDEILKAEDWRFEHGSPAACSAVTSALFLVFLSVEVLCRRISTLSSRTASFIFSTNCSIRAFIFRNSFTPVSSALAVLKSTNLEIRSTSFCKVANLLYNSFVLIPSNVPI
jgi:hypothetical protein